MTDTQTERTLSSEAIYDGRIIKLRVDSVELPNGKTARREVIRHPGAVAIVPLLPPSEGGGVMLIRQFRYAAQQSLWEIPAGTLEPDENPDDCAYRELQEEIGYKPGRLEKLGGIFVAPGYTSEYIHLYLATDLLPSRLASVADEFISAQPFSWEDVLRMIREGVICDGKTISGLLMAWDRLREGTR